MKRNDYSLLPYTRQDIYGLSPKVSQILGWEIIQFDIVEQWKYCSGDDVIVAVIDTGCDLDHPDLSKNLLQGINLIDSKKDPIDDNGHGTHVCGTIGASHNSIGMVGVAPNTKILPIKALDGAGSGSNKDIARGIVYAADRGSNLIAMSLGSPNFSQALYDAIIYATKKNSIIFCAAGNAGENTTIMYPAKHKETIAIGSIDRNLNRSTFTCKGEELDFLCPGQDIFSCVPNNTYAIMSGTSMANPFAVGCASLVLSFYKSQKQEHKLSSKEDYINLFKQMSKSLKNSKYAGKKEYEGYGIIYPSIGNITAPPA